MIKCVLAIVLLHLGCSSLLHIDVSEEIINGLQELDKLYRKRLITVPEPLSLKELESNPLHCAGVFVRTLKQVLENVTISEEDANVTSVVKKLKTSLKRLPPYPENDSDCKVKSNPRRPVRPFKQYSDYIRSLNRMKR